MMDAPGITEPSPPRLSMLTRDDGWIYLCACLLPVMPVLFLTLEWLAACLWLGRPPEAKVHDPMSISTLSSILHVLTLTAVTAFLPTSIGVAIAAFMAWGNRPRAWRILGAVAFLTTGSAAIWIANPFNAVHWWLT